MIYQLEIKEKAIGKGRPRFTKSGVAYTPDKTRNYETMISLKFKEKYKIQPSEKPIKATLVFGFEPPKSASKKKREELLKSKYTKKPDVDNLVKAILDALNGIAYKDDSQIFDCRIVKHYHLENYIYIELEEID